MKTDSVVAFGMGIFLLGFLIGNITDIQVDKLKERVKVIEKLNNEYARLFTDQQNDIENLTYQLQQCRTLVTPDIDKNRKI